ncbi:MAG: CHASE domain-containing protein, partial [Magnetococcales bacterium]|nr:CHASE domain-containing protein [Magnetococcales bacterium]
MEPTSDVTPSIHSWSYARRILILSITYLVAGKAGLALAIPPGYATAIFPASGVALAALLLWGWRLWPGVLLGSLVLNLWVTLAGGQILTPTALTISMGIASGAVLQALFGQWMIRRFVGFPSALDLEAEVIRFLLLGGVLSCLVSATVGVLTLWTNGAVAEGNVLFSWWTWWVGDALGVLLGTPIILTLFGTPQSLWRTRRWSVALPMTVVALAIIPAFISASHWESQRVILEFRKQAALLQQTLESNIQLNLSAIHALRDYAQGIEQMNFKGFSRFAEGTLARFPSLHAISYNPRISSQERAAFEAAIQREIQEDYSIRERHPERGLITASDRSEYVAVAYIQPLSANRNAWGFDVASNPVRKVALDAARDTGTLVATASITLVQEVGSQAGVLAFLPIYSGEKTPSIVQERRNRLQAYAVGVFRVGDLLASSLSGVSQKHFAARLYDENIKDNKGFLTGYGGGNGLWDKEAPLDTGLGLEGPWWSQTLEFGGRTWRLELSPTRATLEDQRSWGAWFVLAGGMLFGSLLGGFLLIITGRTSRIERLVHKRTKELADSESRTRAIVESAVNGIITTDDQGVMQFVNPAASRLFGYKIREMEGRKVNMLMPAPHRENHDAYLKRYLETGEATIIDVSREVEGIHRDGSAIPLSLSVSDVQLADGRIFTGILHDLTERKKADRLKNEFVSTVSHELRTPLTS